MGADAVVHGCRSVGTLDVNSIDMERLKYSTIVKVATPVRPQAAH